MMENVYFCPQRHVDPIVFNRHAMYLYVRGWDVRERGWPPKLTKQRIHNQKLKWKKKFNKVLRQIEE